MDSLLWTGDSQDCTILPVNLEWHLRKCNLGINAEFILRLNYIIIEEFKHNELVAQSILPPQPKHAQI